MADDSDTQDWVANCNEEGQEGVVRDSEDCGVVVMAVAAEDSGGGQRRQRRTTTAADDNDMQDWVVDYSREGQEQAAKDSRDSKVAMMAVAVEDGGGGQQWQRRRMTAVDNKGSG